MTLECDFKLSSQLETLLFELGLLKGLKNEKLTLLMGLVESILLHDVSSSKGGADTSMLIGLTVKEMESFDLVGIDSPSFSDKTSFSFNFEIMLLTRRFLGNSLH